MTSPSNDENTITEPMDFRRIMAAWNACEGISTEALESGVVVIIAKDAQAPKEDDPHDNCSHWFNRKVEK